MLLSPVDCNANPGTTYVTNASARFYDLTNVPDVDANNDGWIDGTEVYIDTTGDGVLDTLDEVNTQAVDYQKGWTCFEMPVGDEGTYAWDVTV